MIEEVDEEADDNENGNEDDNVLSSDQENAMKKGGLELDQGEGDNDSIDAEIMKDISELKREEREQANKIKVHEGSASSPRLRPMQNLSNSNNNN